MKNQISKIVFNCLIMMIISSSAFSQTGVVTIDQDRDIEKLLEYKKDLRTIEFYKIQIFSNSTRAEAEKTRSEFRNSFPYSTDMVYDPPNYKIQVGNFRTRLEADRAMVEIRKKYTNAFIFKPRKKN